jgi:hypothetical protein
MFRYIISEDVFSLIVLWDFIGQTGRGAVDAQVRYRLEMIIDETANIIRVYI